MAARRRTMGRILSQTRGKLAQRREKRQLESQTRRVQLLGESDTDNWMGKSRKKLLKKKRLKWTNSSALVKFVEKKICDEPKTKYTEKSLRGLKVMQDAGQRLLNSGHTAKLTTVGNPAEDKKSHIHFKWNIKEPCMENVLIATGI